MTRTRVDDNQREIVVALRQVGARVAITSSVGHGYPDLTVLFRDEIYLLEVKTAQGRLTPEERDFQALWPVSIVKTPKEALEAIHAS